jgi:hypothetical protein
MYVCGHSVCDRDSRGLSMHAFVFVEFFPGCGLTPEGPYMCPGCWAEEMKRPVPTGKELVDWFSHAFFALESNGVALTKAANAADAARDYAEEPWHE